MLLSFPFNLEDLDYADYKNNPIVFLDFDYRLEGIIGTVVHFSERRKLVNIKLYKRHPLYNIIKDTGIDLDLKSATEDNKLIALSVVPKLPQ